jgi:hypothetical protein
MIPLILLGCWLQLQCDKLVFFSGPRQRSIKNALSLDKGHMTPMYIEQQISLKFQWRVTAMVLRHPQTHEVYAVNRR